MKNIGDCLLGEECILIVQNGKHKMNLPTKIVQKVDKPSSKFGWGIYVDEVLINERRVTFNGVKVTLEYHNKEDKRLYLFNINNIGYDYANNRILLCSRQMAIPVNHRRAYRVNCGLDIKYRSTTLHNENFGYCRDISYLGAGLVIHDKRRQIKIGDKITAYMELEKERSEVEFSGRVVRILDNFLGGKTLVGIEFYKTTRDIEMLVNKLQSIELQKRSKVKNRNL